MVYQRLGPPMGLPYTMYDISLIYHIGLYGDMGTPLNPSIRYCCDGPMGFRAALNSPS